MSENLAPGNRKVMKENRLPDLFTFKGFIFFIFRFSLAPSSCSESF